MSETNQTNPNSKTHNFHLHTHANTQVGGHTQLLTLDKSTLCKPLVPRELLFYLNVPKELVKFVPSYKGVVQIRETGPGLFPPVLYQPLRSPKSRYSRQFGPGSSCTLPAKLGSSVRTLVGDSDQKVEKEPRHRTISGGGVGAGAGNRCRKTISAGCGIIDEVVDSSGSSKKKLTAANKLSSQQQIIIDEDEVKLTADAELILPQFSRSSCKDDNTSNRTHLCPKLKRQLHKGEPLSKHDIRHHHDHHLPPHSQHRQQHLLELEETQHPHIITTDELNRLDYTFDHYQQQHHQQQPRLHHHHHNQHHHGSVDRETRSSSEENSNSSDHTNGGYFSEDSSQSITDLCGSPLELKVQIKQCSDEKILKKNLSQENLLKADYISRPNEKCKYILEVRTRLCEYNIGL